MDENEPAPALTTAACRPGPGGPKAHAPEGPAHRLGLDIKMLIPGCLPLDSVRHIMMSADDAKASTHRGARHFTS